VHDDGREWRGEGCSAEIVEHEHTGPGELGWEHYRVAGNVACDTASSESDRAAPALELESFTFVVTIPWG
jgi:hypothetical protein